MISPNQQEILRRIGAICELAPDLRLGQIAAHLEFLAQDMFDRGLGEIEDSQLLQVIQRHEAELSQRKTNVA